LDKNAADVAAARATDPNLHRLPGGVAPAHAVLPVPVPSPAKNAEPLGQPPIKKSKRSSKTGPGGKSSKAAKKAKVKKTAPEEEEIDIVNPPK
jgi:hypothetical protein